MKLREWIDFNWQVTEDKRSLCSLGDIYIKLLNKKSFKKEDVVLTTLIKPEDAKRFFGEMNVLTISTHEENNYRTVSVLIYEG